MYGVKTPLPHQIEDAAFLVDRSDRGGALYSEPGTGKTMSAITAILKKGAGPIMVACPVIATRMWEKELSANLNGAKVLRIKGGSTKIPEGTDAVVVPYDTAKQKSMSQRLYRFLDEDGIAILDESDYLKTMTSQRSKAFYGMRAEMIDCILEDAGHIWALTGTPIRRYADDVYAHLRAVHPDIMDSAGLTTIEKFQAKFCVMVAKKYGSMQRAVWMPVDNKNVEELRQLVYGNGLAKRRTLQEVIDTMPPLVFKEVNLTYKMTPELAEAMLGLPKGYDVLGGVVRRDPALTTIRRCLGVAKAEELVDYIVEVAATESGGILVPFWHHDVADILEETLSSLHLRVQRIDGGTSDAKKAEYEDAFNNRELDILLGQIQAIGVSLNLQEGGNHVIFAELPWSPSEVEQVYKRLWRWGQEKSVRVDYAITEHEVELANLEVLDRKAKGIDTFHGGSDAE